MRSARRDGQMLPTTSGILLRLILLASLLALFACSPGETTPAPTISVSANPQSVVLGSNTQVTITLTTKDAVSCLRSSPDNASFFGSFVVSPNQSTTYSGTCTGPGGTTTWSITVTVTIPTPSVTLTAIPSSVEAGSLGNVLIQMRTSNVLSCVRTPGNLPVSGDFQVPAPNQSTTYSVSCLGLDGVTTVTANVTVIVTDIPSINVQAYGVDGTGPVSVSGVTAVFSSGSWKDSLVLGVSGSGAMPAPTSVRAVFGDSVCVKLIDRTPNSILKSSIGCTSKGSALASEVQSFTLGTKVWSITQGSFAGNGVPISITSAKTPASDGSKFYPDLSGEKFWAIFPIAWAIDRSRNAVSAADSVNQSLAFDSLTSALGPSYTFKASQMGQDVVANVRGVRILIDSILPPNVAAMAGGGGPVGNFAQFGAIVFRLSAYIVNGIAEHETIHILGFSHTCSWFSIMAVACSVGGLRATVPTVTDVAYIQFFYAVRGMQVNKQTKYGLDGMYRAELTDAPAGLRAQLKALPKASVVRTVNGMSVISN